LNLRGEGSCIPQPKCSRCILLASREILKVARVASTETEFQRALSSLENLQIDMELYEFKHEDG
jgi:hypothetical protein